MKKRLLLITAVAALAMLTSCGNVDSTTSEDVILPQTETTTVTTAVTDSVPEITESDVTTGETTTDEQVTTTAPQTETTTEATTTTTSIVTEKASGTMYANKTANVRNGNSTDYDIILTINQNTPVEITGVCENGWYAVKVDGKSGYMASSVLSDSEITTTTTTTTAVVTTTAVATTTAAATTTAKKVHSYDGTNRLDGVKIGLDPGHQRYGNSGQETVAPWSSATKAKVSGGTSGVSTGIAEYVTNLEIALMLKAKLEAEGAVVYMTRESHDVDISNQERTKMMNKYGVDLMLRIHCDGAANSNARGIGLFVSKSNGIAKISYDYAQKMLPVIIKYTGANNRGVTQNDDYTGQNWAEVPCMMIECGFLSNAQDDKLLNSADYQEKLTDGIVEGIVACFAA